MAFSSPSRPSGDDEDIPDARHHEHGHRIIDHRFVINGQELLGHSFGDGIKPGAAAAGEDDSFHNKTEIDSWSFPVSDQPRDMPDTESDDRDKDKKNYECDKEIKRILVEEMAVEDNQVAIFHRFNPSALSQI